MDYPSMIKKQTKKLLHFTPWRKTKRKLSYEDLLVDVKNRFRRDFLRPFCIKVWQFFHRTGIFFNNRLSWDDREINKETITLYPVEKDQKETKLYRFDLIG